VAVLTSKSAFLGLREDALPWMHTFATYALIRQQVPKWTVSFVKESVT
jgi:hypothetical protein